MISQEIPCPATLIPTKAEITNAFSKIAQMPSKLELEGLSDEADKIRDVLEDLKKPFSAYYPDFKGIEKPEIEWEFTVTRFLQDFNVYVPVTIMDIVSKVVPIEFTVNVAGLDIDLKSMLTSDGKIALRDTIREEIDSVKNFLPEESLFFRFDIFLSLKCLVTISKDIRFVVTLFILLFKLAIAGTILTIANAKKVINGKISLKE